MNKVGLGRNEPNKDPVLDLPKEGRDWLSRLDFLDKLVSGIGSFYGNIFKWVKIFGIVFSVAMVAYVVSQLVKT